MHASDLMAVAFKNAHLLHGGSIRKAEGSLKSTSGELLRPSSDWTGALLALMRLRTELTGGAAAFAPEVSFLSDVWLRLQPTR